MATKPNTKELRVTLPATTRDKLDTIAADAWRKVPDMVAYLIETYNPAAVNPVNPVNPAPAQAEEPKRGPGRPAAQPATKKPRRPVQDIIYIKPCPMLDEGIRLCETVTTNWLIKTPIGDRGDIYWVCAKLIAERDPDHPTGYKAPHAFVLDEYHHDLAKGWVYQTSDWPEVEYTTPQGYAGAYIEYLVDGVGFDTEEEALAWAGEQMDTHPEDVAHLWLMPGRRL